MKKTLSLILSLIMALAVLSLAAFNSFAADENDANNKLYYDDFYECGFMPYSDGYNESGNYEMFFVNYDTGELVLLTLCDEFILITYM